MITADVVKSFEELWKRPGIYNPDQTYGQSFAQYTGCAADDSTSIFLCNAPYRDVKTWIEDQLAQSKIQDNKGAGSSASL